MQHFTTYYAEILDLINAVNPVLYGQSRNYLNGPVTRLSPYVSRGVISTKQIARMVLQKGYEPEAIEVFLKELAWRDYFQQVWNAVGESINNDIKCIQPGFTHSGISRGILEATTGIEAVDTGIKELYETGHLHNHIRMYLASITCNVAKSHWRLPAQWLYYHLLDADWGSNALSWQWVAGSFSNKQYYANQENINKYCNSSQAKTFLDIPYQNIMNMEIPVALKEITTPDIKTVLPQNTGVALDNNLPVYIYNFYNVDCNWNTHIEANRVLLLEPEIFTQYPVSNRTISFIVKLAQNIPGIQIYTGAFDALFATVEVSRINFKQHPLNKHYRGIEHKREWMFDEISGYYPSFFSYWKKCRPYLHTI